MGLQGSYVNYGPGWAGVSGTPFFMFKGSAAEGGMRVPFIVSGPGFQKDVTTDAFAYVSDITPTLLELAGVSQPSGLYNGRDVHPIMGKSMLGFLRGETSVVHDSDDPVAYELAGSAAVFMGNYKLTKSNPPFGDKQWRLFNIIEDPIEVNDLSEQEPEVLATMMASYQQYANEVQLIEVPADYNPVLQVQKNVAKNQAEEILDIVPVTIE
jgi:arylsulfatase A-like enzyme